MTPDEVAVLMGERLEALATPKTRDWWNRYLKGAVPFRGVPMAAIRATVHDVWREAGLDDRPKDDQVETALHLFAERSAEDKVAGVLALAERLLGALTLADVPRLAEPFERGYIQDWSTCDWYCVKVLGRFVEHGDDRRERAQAIAAWCDAASLWQRRAAAVAFVNLAPRGDALFPGFTDLVLDVCASNVRDPERFSQTGVGWVLRELSHAEPARVADFVHAHAEEMSPEARRSATAKLPDAVAARLRGARIATAG